MAASTLLKSCAMPPASWPSASMRCDCASAACASSRSAISRSRLERAAMSARFAFVRSTVARWSVSCSCKISGGPDLNRLARFRGHVGKRQAQLIDRPSDLSGQEPGEQEARGRKASAQHDRPAHRGPSCLLQLRFLDRDAHRPVAHRWTGHWRAMSGSPSREGNSNNPG